jgi:hypothetical protein
MIDCLRAASNDQYYSNNIQDIIPTLTWKLMENADLVELCHGRASFGKLMQVVRKYEWPKRIKLSLLQRLSEIQVE